MTQHLVPFAEHWDLWRSFVLRSAGFPARLATQLGCSALFDAARAVLDAKKRCQETFLAVTEELRRADLPKALSHRKLFRKLGKQRAPEELRGWSQGAEMLHRLKHAQSLEEQALRRYSEAYATQGVAEAEVLRQVAALPAFEEALLWQNPAACSRALPKVRAGGRVPRKHERLIASYLQRYALKNDTVGFFGPTAWGEVTDREDSAIEHKPELVCERRVFFEDWAVHALADAFSANPALLVWARPRRSAAVRLEGDTLRFAGRGVSPVPSFVRHLVSACDGRRAREIAESLASECEDFDTEDDVYECLEQLVEEGVLVWQFEIPSVTGQALALLRAEIAAIDSEEGKRSLNGLDKLAQLRDAVAKEAGAPEALAPALAALREAFEELSGRGSERNAGQMYAGRTIVYEDTRRALSIELGSKALAPLREPIRAPLAAARWFVSEAALRYETRAREAYDRLASESDQSGVEFIALLRALLPSLQGSDSESLIPELQRDLQQRWSALIPANSSERHVAFSSNDIGPRIEEFFPSRSPATPRARYQSPDIMVAASSPEELAEGLGTYVLGELHPGANTLTPPCFLRWHPDEQAAAQAFHADTLGAVVEPVGAKADVTLADPVVPLGEHHEIAMGTSLSRLTGKQCLHLADLFVEDDEGILTVVDRTHGTRFPALNVLESQLQAALTGAFSLVGSSPHHPRVTIDSLVVSRERWSFTSEELPEFPNRGAEQLLGVVRWAESHGMPPQVFFKSSAETKPMFLDLRSAVLVENFVTIARRSPRITLTEMLPTADSAWLRDQAGEQYVSEMRLVMVDRTSAPGQPAGQA